MADDDLLARVHANNRAFTNRDVDGMLVHYAPNAVAADLRPVGFGEFCGHDELRAYYAGLFDNTEELREDLEVLAARDGVVVAACRLWARLAGTGGEFSQPYGLVTVWRDRHIHRLEVHEDGPAALRASGLAAEDAAG
jgi:ketosteroid isomerase-like protein